MTTWLIRAAWQVTRGSGASSSLSATSLVLACPWMIVAVVWIPAFRSASCTSPSSSRAKRRRSPTIRRIRFRPSAVRVSRSGRLVRVSSISRSLRSEAIRPATSGPLGDERPSRPSS